MFKDAAVGFFSYRWFATHCKCSLYDIDLAMHVSGESVRGLVISGVAVCIRLLWPL